MRFARASFATRPIWQVGPSPLARRPRKSASLFELPGFEPSPPPGGCVFSLSNPWPWRPNTRLSPAKPTHRRIRRRPRKGVWGRSQRSAPHSARRRAVVACPGQPPPSPGAESWTPGYKPVARSISKKLPQFKSWLIFLSCYRLCDTCHLNRTSKITERTEFFCGGR